MVVRLLSKFDLRRLCKSIGATALPRIVSTYMYIIVLNFQPLKTRYIYPEIAIASPVIREGAAVRIQPCLCNLKNDPMVGIFLPPVHLNCNLTKTAY